MIKFCIKFLENRGYIVLSLTGKKGIVLDQSGQKFKIFKTAK